MQRLLMPLMLASFIGCAEGISDPDGDDIAGTYAASMFLSADAGPGQDTDHLKAGARFTIVLHANQTMTGELFIPGANDDGSDLVADMAGTWSLNGRIVTFDQAAATFVREGEFHYTAMRALFMQEPVEGVMTTIMLDRQ